MLGGIIVEPFELEDRLDRIAVLVRDGDGGGLRALGDDEVVAVTEAATAAQQELYLDAVDWTPRYRIEYGAYLFANHLNPFFELAGVDGDAGARIAAACGETAERLVDDLLADPEIPSIWTYVATTETPLYWPAVPA